MGSIYAKMPPVRFHNIDVATIAIAIEVTLWENNK